MGLLDDAIREHLELKRQHGADATEVARQEHEAFGAARAGATPPAPATDAADLGVPEADVPTPGPSAPPPEPDAIPEPTVLPDPPPPAAAPPAGGGAVSLDRYEPDVEWDEPRKPAPEPEAAAEADEDEDVLEETPEFLSETPEHDRLWFEQRPPRDFDF